jgi:hypothetical protein
MSIVEGVIVKGKMPGYFLGRNMSWVKLSYEYTPYVHSKVDIACGGTWVSDVQEVIPGTFSRAEKKSQATGKGMSWPNFVCSFSLAEAV